MMPGWRFEDIPPLRSLTAVVTGGNTWFGFRSVRELVRRGARVFLTSRGTVRAQAAAGEILADPPGARIEGSRWTSRVRRASRGSMARALRPLGVGPPNPCTGDTDSDALPHRLWKVTEEITGSATALAPSGRRNAEGTARHGR